MKHRNILGELQEEYEMSTTDSIGELPVMFAPENAEDENVLYNFDFEGWESHRSPARYFRLLIGIFFGSTTRRVLPIVTVLGVFSALTSYYNIRACTDGDDPGILLGGFYLPQLELPLTPFELTAPVLGLLLVFRTDAAYNRFSKGSTLAWEITSSLRTSIRRLVAWSGANDRPQKERDAAKELVDASLLLHGWIMGTYLTGAPPDSELKQLMQQERSLQVELLCKALDVEDNGDSSAAEIFGEHESTMITPYLAITALSLGAAQRLPSFTDQELVAFDESLDAINCNLAQCEDLLRTPIPLGYTRSAIRFLWIWLSLLPFALFRTFVNFGGLALPFAMLFIGFIFLSIEDIAIQIEEPFEILPLEMHQKWLMQDVKQTKQLMKWSDCRRSSTCTINGAAATQPKSRRSTVGTESGPNGSVGRRWCRGRSTSHKMIIHRNGVADIKESEREIGVIEQNRFGKK